MSRIVVIGGGVIGLWSAYELRRRGAEVVVLDAGGPEDGCSWANAGWVVPSFSDPLPAPGLALRALGWLLLPQSPFHISPRALPGLARWLISFWRYANPREYETAFNALARLNSQTLTSYDALRTDGVDFEMHRPGLLFAFERAAEVRHIQEDLDRLRAYGYPEPQRLGPAEVRAFEPALSPRLAAGLLVEGERCVRPESLVAGLERRLGEMGVEVRRGAAVIGFTRWRDRITGALTRRGRVEGTQFLIAAGAWSAPLARRAGVVLPLTAAKGYSITLQDPALRLHHLVYLTEAKVACTPLDGAVRFAGTLELSGVNRRADSRRFAAVRRAVHRALGTWPQAAAESTWMGLRPVTPDGLPLIGRLRDDVFIAAGHGMLGITLAPATAQAIAGAMLERRVEADLRPFDPLRFIRRSAEDSAATRTRHAEAPQR